MNYSQHARKSREDAAEFASRIYFGRAATRLVKHIKQVDAD
jgi:hypothetical protein